MVKGTNTSISTCFGQSQVEDTLFSYVNGNLTTIDPPGPNGTLTFTYDGASRIKTVTDGRKNVSRYTYDALDRITRIDIEKPAGGGAQSLSAEIIPPDTSDNTWIIYAHDLNGTLTTRKDNQGNEGFDYDALNRMKKQTPQSVNPTKRRSVPTIPDHQPSCCVSALRFMCSPVLDSSCHCPAISICEPGMHQSERVGRGTFSRAW